MTRLPFTWAGAIAVGLLCAAVASAQPTITTTSLPDGDVNQSPPYSATLTATDGDPCACTWAITGGSLPSGLNLDMNSGIISGAASTSGPVSITVTATDANGTSAPVTFNFNVNPELLITNTSPLPGGTQGVAYNDPLTATGGNSAAYSWSLVSVHPPAAWLSVTGASLTATTPLAGKYSVTVQVTDTIATVSSSPLTLVISPPPLMITSPTSLPAGEATVAYPSTPFTASGGTQPYTWTVTSGNLPGGMTFTGGTLAGTPSAAFSGNVTFQVMDANSQTTTTTLALNIIAGPSISPTTLPNADAGAYNQTLTASGGTPAYTWLATSGSLPTGTTLNATTGTISGSAAAGAYNFTVKVTDSIGGYGTQGYTVTINPALSITPAFIPQGDAGTAYSQTLAVTGGAAPYNWSISSATLPPPGITLSAAGVLSGTTSTTGSFPFTVKVTDNFGGSATQAYTLTINPALSITPPSIPQGDAGAPYSQTLSVAGGAGPYNWSISSATLPPPGITLSAAGVLSGTTSTNGLFPFTVKVTDSVGGSATQPYNLTINPQLSITTPPTLSSGTVGVAYSQPLSASGGASPYTWSVTKGSLGSLTLNGTTGLISGMPTSSGTLTFTVQVMDGISVTASKDFTITIVSGLTITNAPTLSSGEVNVLYSVTLMAAGGTPPYTWSITTGSPANLSLNSSTGVISGTPTASGTFMFTVKVTDNATVTATEQFTLTIAQALTIISAPALPGGSLGIFYSQTISASGGVTPYSWSITAGQPPPGVTLSSGGVLSGTPTASGPFTFTVKVTDSLSVSATQPFTLTIASGLTIITAPALPGGEVNVLYSQTLIAAGGTQPYTWSITAGQLPANVNLSPGGVISGTPTASGSFIFTVKVTDSASVSVSKQFTLSVAAVLAIATPPSLPPATVDVAYGQTLTASGGVAPYHWSIVLGSLPKGLGLDAATGAISGASTTVGSFSFTVQVSDSASGTATKQFTLSIISGLVITTGTTLPSGSVGVPYAAAFTATGGTPPYRWVITFGALPDGLALVSSTGSIGGTPKAAGTFQFTAQVADSSSLTASQPFTLTIAPGLVIATPSPLPGGSVGAAYSVKLTAVGGTAPYRWLIALGSVSPLSLDPATGVLSGTPAAGGNLTFTVQVTDNASNNASKQFTLSIAGSLAITGSPTLPAGKVNLPYSQALTAAGGTPPYTWSGTLPNGLGISSDGVISGTPQASGSFTFTVKVTDSASSNATQQFTLVVTPKLIITTPAALNGVAGTPFSTTLAATGGTGSYTWSITSVTPGPAWVSVTNPGTGAIGGTPPSAANYTVAVDVVDTNGATASATFTISVGLPAAPKISVNGVPSTSTPAQQINVGLTLDSGYKLDIKGEITLTFQPDATAPADDPSIQFSTGGRTVNFTVPANTTTAVFPAPQLALQTGTVAGTITLSFALQAAGADLTVTGLDRTIAIARSAPSILSATVTKNTSGFQLSVQAYSTPRDLSQAHVTFTQAAGANLQTTDFVLDLTSEGTAFYKDQNNDKYGSQFILLLPFTASQGSISAVASAKIDLKNSQGTSPAVTVKF